VLILASSLPGAVVANVKILIGIEISKNLEALSIVPIFRVSMPKVINLARHAANLAGYG